VSKNSETKAGNFDQPQARKGKEGQVGMPSSPVRLKALNRLSWSFRELVEPKEGKKSQELLEAGAWSSYDFSEVRLNLFQMRKFTLINVKYAKLK